MCMTLPMRLSGVYAVFVGFAQVRGVDNFSRSERSAGARAETANAKDAEDAKGATGSVANLSVPGDRCVRLGKAVELRSIPHPFAKGAKGWATRKWGTRSCGVFGGQQILRFAKDDKLIAEEDRSIPKDKLISKDDELSRLVQE